MKQKLIRLLNSHLIGFLVDTVSIVTSKERLRPLLHIPLYSNALYLMIASVIGGVLGFVFWIIVARFYSPEDVGLASATIAAMGLLGTLSHLGFGFGLIRFLPNSGDQAMPMINSCFTVATLTSALAVAIFIAGLGIWSPALLFLRQNPIYLAAFITFTIATTLTSIANDTFIAERRAVFAMARTIIFGFLKIILVILLATFLHSFGIFASWGISLAVALLLGIFLFLPRVQPGYRPHPTLKRHVVNELMHFSLANNIAYFLSAAPGLILPIMVLNLLGAELNAYFYIAWATSTALIAIPTSISMSLFTEGSYEEEELGANIWRSLKMVFVILVPIVILVLAFADKLLLLFGTSYSQNATMLLRILALALLPLAVNQIYFGMVRVQKRLKVLISLASFIAITTLGLSYVLLPRMGINGTGIAWLTSQGAVALWIAAGSFKRRLLSRDI